MLGLGRRNSDIDETGIDENTQTPAGKKHADFTGLGNGLVGSETTTTTPSSNKDRLDFSLFIRDREGNLEIYDESPVVRPLPFRKRHLIPRNTPRKESPLLSGVEEVGKSDDSGGGGRLQQLLFGVFPRFLFFLIITAIIIAFFYSFSYSIL